MDLAQKEIFQKKQVEISLNQEMEDLVESINTLQADMQVIEHKNSVN